MNRAFIGVGSNISPEENVRKALRQLAQSEHLVSISTFYRVPALDRPEEPNFYNGVVAIDTHLPPAKLKWDVLHRIESDVGRRRSADKYASRPIDLDLLLYGDLVVSSDELTLPDPDVLKRAFLAVPLYEIAPALMLPGLGVSIREVVAGFGTENMQPLNAYRRQLQNELLAGHNGF